MAEDNNITVFQVDSFTDQPFKGNPAGVCILEEPLEDAVMANIAAEINASETAFAVKVTAGPMVDAYKFNLRWFTPKCEVDLCGHATLAAAKVLHEIYELNHDKITFATHSGDLIANRKGEFHQLDFPAGDPEKIELTEYMINALNLYKGGLNELIQEACLCTKTKKLLIRFTDPKAIHEITPNFNELLQVEPAFGSKGIIVTSTGEKAYDFISRYFAPLNGVNEDPVTGSAHTVLGMYWWKMLDKKRMLAYQASKRGGELIVEIKEDPHGHRHRVIISGKSVIVLQGVIKF